MVTIIVTNIRTLQNMDTSILSIYSSFEVGQPFIRHSNIITDSQ